MVLRISLKRREALIVDRITTGNLKLAYIICADRKIKYSNGRSRIVYIGTTKNGVNRVAQSAAKRSDAVFGLHGVNSFKVHIVTCTPRRNVKSWHKLERALLLTFKERFGRVPHCNSHGKKTKWRNEEDLFRKKRLRNVIEDLS